MESVVAQQAASVIARHLSTDDWRIRHTLRLRFDDATTVEYVATVETRIPDDLASSASAGERTPIPIASLLRLPAHHVRCFMDGEEIAITTRAVERSMCASWATSTMLDNPDWEKAILAKFKPGKCVEYQTDDFKTDVEETWYSTLDAPLSSSTRLKCGLSTDEAWKAIAPIPGGGWIRKMFENTRVVVALPVLKSTDHRHRCFTLSYHETVYPRPRLFREVKRSLRRTQKGVTHENASDFGRWTGRDRSPTRSDKAWEYKLAWVQILRPWRRKRPTIDAVKADPKRYDPQPQSHTLVISDGSAMQIAHASGRPAEELYWSRWRLPWESPDNTVIDIPCGQVLGAESFHFELAVPEGTFIRSAVLTVRNNRSEMILVEDDDMHTDRAHLHFTKKLSTHDTVWSDYFASKVRLILRPTWHNGLRAALFAQVTTFLTLAILLVTIGMPIVGVASPIPVGKLSDSSEAIVAIITLAPTIALSWIARQSEHMLTKRVQGRLRFRLGISAGASYVAALAIAFNSSRQYVFVVLCACTVLSLLSMLITAYSGFISNRLIREIERPGRNPG